MERNKHFRDAGRHDLFQAYSNSQWWYRLSRIPLCIKWAYQRARYGYSEYDLYDLDEFLRHLLINGVRDLADRSIGAPSEYFDEQNDSNEPWVQFLHTMADHFERVLPSWVAGDPEEVAESRQEFEEGFKMLHEAWFNLWD